MSKKPTSGTFGGSDYQRGALERLAASEFFRSCTAIIKRCET